MILDLSLRLEAVLAAAVAANQPEVTVDYLDWNSEAQSTTPAVARTALNSTTDVTILAAPVLNPKRDIQRVTIYNKDTASVQVTVKTDDGTTERILVRRTLTTLQSLCFEKNAGWYVLATS